jgi:hypothetical protein
MATVAPLMTGDVARRLRRSENYVRVLEKGGRLIATRTSTGVRLYDPASVERLARELEQRGR